MIEAAAKGASSAIPLVANVAAMLITFFAFIAFFNGVLSYLGSLVGYPELSFQASYLECLNFVVNYVEIVFKVILVCEISKLNCHGYIHTANGMQFLIGRGCIT